MAVLLTPGRWGDAPQLVEVLDRSRVPRPLGVRPRTRPDHVSGDKAYSSRRNRRYLRRRHIRHTIPEPKDQRANRHRRGSAGGRPTGFDRDCYRRRNEVERTINRLKNSRAVATRLPRHGHRRCDPASGSASDPPDRPLTSSRLLAASCTGPTACTPRPTSWPD